MLEARARLLGKEHPDTLTSMNNLAQTLYAQGDLARAHELQEQVVEAMARLLGKEHPNTLTSMNNLAQTLKSQGDLAGARKLQELVLEARARLLGKEHPQHPDVDEQLGPDVVHPRRSDRGTQAPGAGA